MSRIPDFIDYLNSHIGDAYIWGAQGQELSAMSGAEITAFVKKKETSDTNARRAINFIEKSAKNPLYAFDCSGLIMHWFQDIKGWSGDKSANSLYKESMAAKLTATTNLDAGDLLFRHNGAKAYHVGVYVGDGLEIEAKGRDDGVVLTPVNRSYWTHYGKHPYLYKVDESSDNAVPKVVALTTPYMRGDDVKNLQIALTALGYDCGEADGIAGAKTIEAVKDFAAAHAEAADLPKAISCTVVINGEKYVGKLEV